jgi:ankyrin repeat protein
VNAPGEQGNTLLHEAVRQEHPEAVQLLLGCGAGPTDKNGWGQTALDVARICKRNDLIELLEGASSQETSQGRD